MAQLTKKEKTVIEVFWRSKECLSIHEVAMILPNESKHTITAIANQLLKKEFIKVEKIEIIGKSLARKFSPTVSEEEFLLSILPERILTNLVVNQIKQTTDNDYLELLEKNIAKRKQLIRKY